MGFLLDAKDYFIESNDKKTTFSTHHSSNLFSPMGTRLVEVTMVHTNLRFLY